MRTNILKNLSTITLVLSLLLFVNLANAECGLTVKIKNMENSPIRLTSGKVKSKLGSWTSLGFTFRNKTIEANETYSNFYNAAFRCNAGRRYQLRFSHNGNWWVEYYPSHNTWTKNATVLVRAKR